MLASVVLNRSNTTLLDQTGVLWSASELLDYLNAAITAIISIKPDTYILTTSFTLINAQAKQTIPSGGLQLVDITRNLSPSLTPIRQVERNHLNHTNTDWLNTAGTPSHFTYDSRNPKIFYIYPQPASGTNTVELVYSTVPARLTAASDTLPIEDIYETAMYYFILAMAYAKNAKRGDLNKSSLYFNLFTNALGIRKQVQNQFGPTTPTENPQGAGQKKGPTE